MFHLPSISFPVCGWPFSEATVIMNFIYINIFFKIFKGVIMAMEINDRIQSITNSILSDYTLGRDVDNMNVFAQPDKNMIVDITKKLLTILYPGYYRDKTYRSYNYSSRISVLVEDVFYNLQKQIAITLRYLPCHTNDSEERIKARAEEVTAKYLERIPKIRALVDKDMQAAFEGDPAAFNKEETVICYPGMLAISINRLAHELFLLKVPLIPRIMTEYAHSRTGIDIHPGATIGEYFFMDHGTGIVIGETTVIGQHVKIYQGVTLGALSTRGGQRLRGSKRHPTIEDDVTIYAGASILGGDTVIGQGSVIGSNVFITSSLKPGTKISAKNQEFLIHGDGGFEVQDDKPNNVWYYNI